METMSDEDLGKRLDHLDEGIHAIQQQLDGLQSFIDEHRPALARSLSLMDPGAKLRGLVTGKKRS